jgi:hypothetical protein
MVLLGYSLRAVRRNWEGRRGGRKGGKIIMNGKKNRQIRLLFRIAVLMGNVKFPSKRTGGTI